MAYDHQHWFYAVKFSINDDVNIFLHVHCTGNLDERVTERVLYDIVKEAGRVVDLHIPKDRETDRPKGYAFAEYETEEVAEYAVKLFSGLVNLYNRTLKFAVRFFCHQFFYFTHFFSPFNCTIPTIMFPGNLIFIKLMGKLKKWYF